MLSFTSGLSADIEAFAIFVNDKYDYKDKRNILSNSTIQKINSFLRVLKVKKKEDEISSFDISDKQKCFIIKVKKKYENYFPQEIGGSFFSYLKTFKDIKKIDLYLDSLDLDKRELIIFFSQFIFGFDLKSYTFNKYKTQNNEEVNKKVNYKIITSDREKIEKKYKYYEAIKEGIFLTRDLVSEPPNILNPKTYVREIQKLSKLG